MASHKICGVEVVGCWFLVSFCSLNIDMAEVDLPRFVWAPKVPATYRSEIRIGDQRARHLKVEVS